MAMREVVQDDVLFCGVCSAVAQELVTLACGHSFCKTCLERPLSQSDYTDSSGTQISCVERTPCPVCPLPSSVQSKNISEIPSDSKLDEATTDSPECSSCKGDENSPPEMYCETCQLLLCKECLIKLHPTEAPQNRHVMIPVEDYIVARQAVNATQMPTKPLKLPTCKSHSQHYCMYCTTCQQLICEGCLRNHNEHTFGSIASIYEKRKTSLVEKSKECKQMKEKIRNMVGNSEVIYQDLQNHRQLQKSAIDRAYEEGTQALRAWRDNSVEVVESRHIIRSDGFQNSIDDMKDKMREMKTLIKSLSSMSYGEEIAVFQDSGRLCESTDVRIKELRKSTKNLERFNKRAERFLKEDPVTYKCVDLTERDIYRPELKFIETSDEALQIRKQGTMLGYRGVGDYDALTDGKFRKGCYYWGFDVTVHPSGTSEIPCGCSIGLVQKGSSLASAPGSTSWYIGANYRVKTFRYWCPAKCGEIQPFYKEWLPNTGPQRLGFFVDFENLRFLVIDCVQNQEILTVSGVSTTSFLTPAVSFWSKESQAALSVRLLSRDLASLPARFFKGSA